MSATRRIVLRTRVALSTIVSLFGSVGRGGRWFLIPFVGVLLLAALLLAAVSVIEYVAPFVYTVF